MKFTTLCMKIGRGSPLPICTVEHVSGYQGILKQAEEDALKSAINSGNSPDRISFSRLEGGKAEKASKKGKGK